MIVRFFRWLMAPHNRPLKLIFVVVILCLIGYGVFSAVSLFNEIRDPHTTQFLTWMQGDEAARQTLITVQREVCPGAPFVLPADGFIGLLYGDPRGPYSSSSPHQGIDIFSDTEPGLTPVYAAYDGYISRESTWRSALIQRVPSDPLQPERQIWLYYTHMADAAGNSYIVETFPQGVTEEFVKQGTLLGYTGNYNGNAARPIWVHLHFSIVQDDGNGRYLNELNFDNTLDPSPYLGMAVNYACVPVSVGCTAQPTCEE